MGKYQAYPEYKDSGVEWMGDIPNEWVTISVGRLYSRTKRTGHSEKELLSVYRDYGVIPKSSRDDNNNKESDDLTPYQLVQPNDLVMNKMKAWQGSIAVSEYEGIVSPAYFVYEPREKLFALAHPRYVHYLLRNPIYITQYMSRSKGIRVNQWDLDPDEFKTIELLLPSKDEQSKIFEFLDHETAKIDTLIEKQQQLIKLLKEKRQAVISHAVTKGLNPEATMKDSGVEWLGEVPEHWEKSKLVNTGDGTRGCFVNGPFGSDLLAHELRDEGVPVVYIRDIKPTGYRRKSTVHVTPQKAQQLEVCKVQAGDVIVSKVGDPPGDSCVYPSSEPEAIITQDVIRIRVDENKFSADFIAYLLNSDFGRMVLNDISVEGTRKRVSLGDFKATKFVFPPLSESRDIVAYLNCECSKIDLVISQADKAVMLMKERRTALISAAVTGKIDVRNWQAPISQDKALEQSA
ncbi:restriction endonuclease subunit S [Vibrio harveyi]